MKACMLGQERAGFLQMDAPFAAFAQEECVHHRKVRAIRRIRGTVQAGRPSKVAAQAGSQGPCCCATPWRHVATSRCVPGSTASES